ncbi:putative cytochrome P450 [Helianthus debilis subsp. tardiflorus]
MISVLGYKIYLTMTSYWSWWWEVNNEQDELARTILTISVLALLLLWYKWMLSYTTKGKTSLPPGPSGLPIVGYLPFLGSNLHERFTEMAHKYGPIFSLRLGSKLHVVVNSTDLVKVVARDLDQTFVNRNTPIVASVITYGEADITFANSKTAQWRNMRKLLVSQVMSNASLKASQIFRTREVKKMVHEVYTKIGKKVNINEIAFNTQFNVVTSILWGCSKSDEGMGSSRIGDGFHEVEMKIVELLGAPNISDIFPWLSWFDLQKRRRDMQRQLEYTDQMFDNIIKKRIKANSSKIDGAVEEDGRKDFLQILLELKDQKDTPVSFDMIQIKSQLMDVIVAANDTTSTMVEWVMAEILNNPVVMRKVQDELTEVFGINNIVEESYLHKLTYLDAVIKETFRLHPPLPLLIQKSPDESCKVGRRICPGIPLGDKMLTYMLASLLHSFEWNLPKDEEFEVNDEFGFVTKKKKSLVAIPSQRLSDKTLYMG